MSKHEPNSCEPSYIHSSSACPEPHVDVIHFDSDGRKDNDHTAQNSHKTDSAHKSWAEDAHGSSSRGSGK